MSIESAYDFPLPGFWSNLTGAEQVYEIDGARYLLRQLGEYLLYRRADNNCVEHTLFVPYRNTRNDVRDENAVTLSLWEDDVQEAADFQDGSESTDFETPLTPPVYAQSVFAEQIASGESGRVALYSCPSARDCTVLLFFRQDGTGFFLDYHAANDYSAYEPTEQVNFVWDGAAYGIADGAEILTVKCEPLELLCRDIFAVQVWPQMKDPFVSYLATPDALMVWECGSEAELKRITTCIFHIQAQEWAELMTYADPFDWEYDDVSDPFGEEHDDIVRMSYVSKREQHPGGPAIRWTRKISELCRIAFRFNVFTGHKWEYSRYLGHTRRKSYELQPLKLEFPITPPSAHERAEALLTLWDWLEGKVSEAERQAYCGVGE